MSPGSRLKILGIAKPGRPNRKNHPYSAGMYKGSQDVQDQPHLQAVAEPRGTGCRNSCTTKYPPEPLVRSRVPKEHNYQPDVGGGVEKVHCPCVRRDTEFTAGTKVLSEHQDLKRITAEISNGMSEMASAAGQISTAVTNVNDLSERNRESTESLTAELDRFKTDA